VIVKPDTFRFTRFERKILWAMTLVAVLPLAAAVGVGYAALSEAYGVGINRRVGEELERQIALYQDYFVLVREDAERTADAVAYDAQLVAALARGDDEGARARLDALAGGYAHVAAATVLREAAAPLRYERAALRDERVYRLLEQQRTLAGLVPGATVSVEVAVRRDTIDAFARAGETAEVYQRLEASRAYFSWTYLLLYLLLLAAVTLVALVVASTLARRVTRRIVTLIDATRRVGAGDLSVSLPPSGADEVAELSRAFEQMVRDMRESRERIEYLQRIGAWQDFARRLAHEIKNPLTPIQLAVQEAHDRYKGDDPAFRKTLDEARAIVEEEVATLRRLVGEFSAFAKLPEARLAPADLGEFAADTTRALGPALEELAGPGVALREERAPAPIPVRIDAMMLKRCVDNLVRNAAQAGARTVVVAARAETGRAVLEVRDDGPGIPEADRARVFDPYFTTRAEGTGLGLAIVKKIVLEHEGAIACDAAPEGGARFRIALPLVGPAAAPRGPAPRGPASPPEATHRPSGRRVAGGSSPEEGG
jgi:nitrogen fixation/metabolism regulation signal transduction histidine kinase